MDETDLDIEALDRVMNLLDECRNMHGPLVPDTRARIYACIAAEGEQQAQLAWENARRAVITHDPETGMMRTLWQAVNDACGSPDHGDHSDRPAEESILYAIARAVGVELPHPLAGDPRED